jgi:hypothetical protein
MDAQPYRLPRFEADAGKYTDEEALERFVPSIVWDQVRRPQHQVLYGGSGTGKTMLLRRLSWPAMLREPNFLDGQHFAAFYIDMRELEDLSSLYPQATPSGTAAAERLSVYFGTIHLVHSIADTLLKVRERVPPEAYHAMEDALIFTAHSVLPSAEHDWQSVVDLNEWLELAKAEFISRVADPIALLSALGESVSVAAPEQTLRLFSMRVRKTDPSLRMGILLDQYEMLPVECQRYFNPLLKRENANAFFTIVASRPFSFNAAVAGGFVRPGEDFDLTVVEHILPEDSAQYIGLLTSIWSRIRPAHPPIDDLLSGGLDYLATLSSRSIRRFLELCRVSGALASQPEEPIPVETQENAATVISRAFRDEVKFASGIPQGVLWDLVLMIGKATPERSEPSPSSLPAQVHLRSSDLFGTETFSPAVLAVLSKAFEEGVLQFFSREDGSSFTIPERFCLAPIVAPILRRQPEFSGRVFIDAADIESLSKPQIGRKASRGTAPAELRQIFLSISFEALPEPLIARELFAESFSDVGIRIVEGRAVGPGLIAQLFEQIRGTDATVLEITSLNANIVVELGLTLGMSHRVIPVRHSSAPASQAVSAYPFLADMGWLNYALTPNSMEALRDKVIRWTREPVSDAHLLQKTLNGAIPLRVQQHGRTVALYYPEHRMEVWERMLPVIRGVAKEANCELLVVQDRPHAKSLDLFDNLVWCISKSDRAIIDTSGAPEPDLYGAFALGFAFGISRKQIIRLEQRNLAHPSGIGMWPRQHYHVWDNPKNLIEEIRRFLPRSPRKKGKR